MRLALLAAILIVVGPALAAEPIVGRVSVTDGDTLVIRDVWIRLYGIDAPEGAQLCQDRAGKDFRCGQAAALALAEHIGEATISSKAKNAD